MARRDRPHRLLPPLIAALVAGCYDRPGDDEPAGDTGSTGTAAGASSETGGSDGSGGAVDVCVLDASSVDACVLE